MKKLRYSNRKILTRKDRTRVRSHEDDIMVPVKSMMSRKTYQIVKEFAGNAKMPLARFVNIAVDNELDTKTPFAYAIPKYIEPKDPMEYATEAALLYKFLQRLSLGMGLDMILLCRRDIGITDKVRLVGAYHHLLETNMIQEKYPDRSYHTFDFSYRVAVIIKREEKKK